MDKILGIGNALTDALVRIDDDAMLQQMRLPKGSMQLIDREGLELIRKTTAGMEIVRSTGGCAGNTIMALARLGAEAGFICKIGDDETGKFFIDSFSRVGVETQPIVGDLPSGIASTFVTSDGERTFGTYLGASATLSADDLSKDMFTGYSYFYIEGYLVQNHLLIERACSLAKEVGLTVCIDLASYNLIEEDHDFFDHLVSRYADIVFANGTEAFALTGKDPLGALDEIASKCSVAIVKSGKRGSLVKKGNETVLIIPCDAPRVDTTGAGDFYSAGFMYALSRGFPLDKCAETASILSNHVIQVMGTSLPDERWKQIKENVDLTLAI